jgi:hypothetical protein
MHVESVFVNFLVIRQSIVQRRIVHFRDFRTEIEGFKVDEEGLGGITLLMETLGHEAEKGSIKRGHNLPQAGR